MRVKLYFASILFLFACGSIYSQDAALSVDKSRKVSLKMYGQILGEVKDKTHKIYFPRVTPAIQLANNKGHFHEFELSNLQYVKTNYTYNNAFEIDFNRKSFRVGLRYSFNYLMVKKNRWSFYLGAGSNLGYNNTYYNPITSAKFPYHQNDYIVQMNLTPRITWNITDHLYLDLNIPITPYQQSWSVNRYSVPFYPNNSYESNGSVFPNQHTVNVGIGLRF